MQQYRRLSDSELMAQFYSGDVPAFDELSRRWTPRLFALFRQSRMTAEDAEDLAVETLVRLYVTGRRGHFDPSYPLKPFIARIARNLLIQELRVRRRSVPAFSIHDYSEVIAADGSCSRSHPYLDLLEECVPMLEPQEQLYIRNCCKHGMGTLRHSEIASLIGVTPARVTQISQSALGKLRRLLLTRSSGIHPNSAPK